MYMAQHHADFGEGTVKVKWIPSAHECQSNWSLGSIYCCQTATKQKGQETGCLGACHR